MRIRIGLIIFALLTTLGISIKVLGNNKEIIPLEKWEKNKKVDREVKEIIEKMDRWARKAEDLDDLGWNLEFVRLGTKLYKVGILGLPEMIKEIKNEDLDWKTRLSIISTIPVLKGIDSVKTVIVPVLGEILLDKSIDKRVRGAICTYGFEKMKDTSATPFLIKTMEDKSNPEEVRWAAIRSVGVLRDERAIPSLWNILISNDSDGIRAITSLSLACMGSKIRNKVDELIKIYNSEKTGLVKERMIWLLSSTKDDRVIPILVKNKHQSAAIKGLAGIGSKNAKKALLSLLNDKDEWVRVDAVEALVSMKDKSVAPKIEEGIKNTKTKQARKVMMKYLKKLKEIR